MVIAVGLMVLVKGALALSGNSNISIRGNFKPGVDNPIDINAENETNENIGAGLIAIGAGLAIGLAGAGAGIGLGTATTAVVAAVTEKPETFGKLLVLLALIEAIAIYGFVIAFVLFGKIQI